MKRFIGGGAFQCCMPGGNGVAGSQCSPRLVTLAAVALAGPLPIPIEIAHVFARSLLSAARGYS